MANRGYLADRNKPIIFSMARLDTVKNLTGLVDWYGKNKKLRQWPTYLWWLAFWMRPNRRMGRRPARSRGCIL